MNCQAFVCDYDGTLASRGRVAPTTLDALARLKAAGRKLLLVSGREVEDLYRVFPQAGIFDFLVLENGAVLYDPEVREARVLGRPPSMELVRKLRDAGVLPLSVGRSIVATTRAHEQVVMAALADEGGTLQIVWNRDALMILPSGIDKGTGVRVALSELGVPPANAVAIGDAENDRELLLACGIRVAVANALPELQRIAHFTATAEEGAGVVEVIEGLLSSDSVVA